MAIFKCVECGRAVPELFKRVHILTSHPITALRLKLENVDVDAMYTRAKS